MVALHLAERRGHLDRIEVARVDRDVGSRSPEHAADGQRQLGVAADVQGAAEVLQGGVALAREDAGQDGRCAADRHVGLVVGRRDRPAREPHGRAVVDAPLAPGRLEAHHPACGGEPLGQRPLVHPGHDPGQRLGHV